MNLPRLLSLLLGVFTATASHAAEALLLPRMPSLELSPTVTQELALTREQIRTQLQSHLPAGTTLVQEGAPPAGGPTGRQLDPTLGEPQPVAANVGYYPVLDLADGKYVTLPHDFIPVLVDWFEALAVSLKMTPDEMRVAGFTSNKVARLMRVFTSMRMRRDPGKGHGMAPAIGWCRILLQEDWGRHRRGETRTFALVGTDQGWFVVDPFNRRMRQLQKNDRRWLVQFVVI